MAKNYTLMLKRQMKSLGVYRDEYEQAVNVAAQLMCQYDELTRRFEEGGMEITERTPTGSKKAPIVTTLESLRKDILAYLSALGLTPAGAKKLEAKPEEQKKNPLAEAIAKLRNG